MTSLNRWYFFYFLTASFLLPPCMQAAAVPGAMREPISLNITPVHHLESLPVQTFTNQNQTISDYVTAYGGSLLASRLQLVPVEAGMHCVSTKYTKVMPFYLSFEPGDHAFAPGGQQQGGAMVCFALCTHTHQGFFSSFLWGFKD